MHFSPGTSQIVFSCVWYLLVQFILLTTYVISLFWLQLILTLYTFESFYPPSQRSCGRGILDYPSSIRPSVRPFALNNFKTFGRILMISHTGLETVSRPTRLTYFMTYTSRPCLYHHTHFLSFYLLAWPLQIGAIKLQMHHELFLHFKMWIQNVFFVSKPLIQYRFDSICLFFFFFFFRFIEWP